MSLYQRISVRLVAAIVVQDYFVKCIVFYSDFTVMYITLSYKLNLNYIFHKKLIIRSVPARQVHTVIYFTLTFSVGIFPSFKSKL